MKWLLRFLMALCLLLTGGYAYLANHAGFQHAHHATFHISKRALHGGFRAADNRALLTIQKAHNSPDEERCSLELNSESEDEDEKQLSVATVDLALNATICKQESWHAAASRQNTLAHSRPVLCCTSPKFIVYRNIRI